MTPKKVGSTRPTDAELVAMLRKAAELILTLCHKDIRKSFQEQNFAANTLGTTARALEAASADKTGSLHRPDCSPDCSTHHRMISGAPYNDEPYTVSGVDYTFTEGC